MTYLAIHDQARLLTLEELRTLRESDVPADTPYRIDVNLGDALLPLLVVRRQHAERLVVLNNGAVDLKRSEHQPVFQRSSWWGEIEAHQVFVCDPGTVGAHAQPLNWLQTATPRWHLKEIVRAIIWLSRSMGSPRPQQRTYYGSSAGGFAALQELAFDPNARSIVNNPQIDWTRWHAHQVRAVLKSRYRGYTAKQVREEYPKRSNCLQNLYDTGARSTIDYWVNMASPHDRDVQLPIALDFIRNRPNICNNFTVHMYHDETLGHNPLGKIETLELLNRG